LSLAKASGLWLIRESGVEQPEIIAAQRAAEAMAKILVVFTAMGEFCVLRIWWLPALRRLDANDRR
jgi:hypothetical protein